MKTRHVVLPAFLIVVLTVPVMGGQSHEDTTKVDNTTVAMTLRMGKPTADATVEGLHFAVWLMTQAEHEVMMEGKTDQVMPQDGRGDAVGMMEMKGMTDTTMGMRQHTKGMKHESMDVNKAMLDSMTADTHHIVLDLTDAIAGKAVPGATARVMVVFPSARTSSLDLKPVMSHLGSPLALDEKGEYRFTVAVSVGGVSRTTQFHYALK